MIILQYIYNFFNDHVTWDFGPEANAFFTKLWRDLGSFLFSF